MQAVYCASGKSWTKIYQAAVHTTLKYEFSSLHHDNEKYDAINWTWSISYQNLQNLYHQHQQQLQISC